MATLRATSAQALLAALGLLAGCSDLKGLSGEAPALARIEVSISGDVLAVRPPNDVPPQLRVALVWGAQWLPETSCVLPPESTEVAAVMAAGCRDPFGFVPFRVGGTAPVDDQGHATIELHDLPAADVMVGGVTARVAYASLVLFDDRDGSGTLELRRSTRDFQDPGGEPDPDPGQVPDTILGASLVSMTEPDERVAFREGGFDPNAAFYPRVGCEPPPKGFSVLAAGGFSYMAALLAVLDGKLPAQDPATCRVSALADVRVTVPVRAPSAELRQVACRGRRSTGFPRYREPDAELDLSRRTFACASLPKTGGADGGVAVEQKQLLLADPADNVCKGLSHIILRGCDSDPACVVPEWDVTASPPDWWPCGP